MLEAPEGMFDNVPLNRFNVNQAISIYNYRVGNKKRLLHRYGTDKVGATATAAPIIGLYIFLKSDGTEVPIRFFATGLEIFNGTTWTAATGTALTGTNTSHIVATAWGTDHLLFTNGVDVIVDLNVAAGTFARIAAAPVCLGLTTFGNRVVASYILSGGTFPYRIQWSIKNDNTDWSSAGSGFEDLLASPGSATDQQVGVYPINDTFALVVRSTSVWGMSLTGFVDAPFSFGRLFANLGCPARYSVVTVPGGIIFVGNDNVYFVSQTSFIHLGDAVRNGVLFANSQLIPSIIGLYDPRWGEYNMLVNPGDASTGHNPALYKCKLETKAWTFFLYGSQCGMALNIIPPVYMYLYLNRVDHTAYGVVKENPGTYTDYAPAFDLSFAVQSSIVLGTIPIPEGYDSTVDIVEIQMDYISAADIAVNIQILDDSTFTVLFNETLTLPLSGTIRMKTVSFRAAAQFVVGSIYEISILTSALSGLEIIAFRPYVLKGARKKF